MAMDHDNTPQEDRMEMLFNYDDIFFSFFYDDEHGCFHRSPDYALNYVVSGEMLLENGREQIRIGKGECVFIPRNHLLTLYKRPANGERYCGIFMRFTRRFLRGMFARRERSNVVSQQAAFRPGTVKLPRTPELESLFASMTPYLDPETKPAGDLMQLKLQEGVLALLHADARFEQALFDFNEPWKIDILEFLEQNYMYEFSLDELAQYTGRSLATFKRDFRKISDLTPEKWLIRRRLDAAYAKLERGEAKVTEICAEVGFKNPSHFATAFKRQFGISPTAVASRTR
jgi:AraC-like DNA-binding protein